jgi:DNA-binding IclR family transcriptional regulator
VTKQQAGAQAGIQSVEVGFALLETLARAPGPLMLRDLAAAAGMSAAKAHRYLVSFQRLRLVVQEPASTRYDLGPAALQLGLATLARMDAVKLARERLEGLAGSIGHTLALAVWGNHGPTLVHWAASPHAPAVNLRLGDVMPLLSSASGLCFAACLPREATAALLREEMARARREGSKDLPTTQAALQALLAPVRVRGLARVVDGLLPGMLDFCAPVFDSNGHPVLGMALLGHKGTLDARWNGAAATALRDAARQLSLDLGFQG